MDRGNDEGYQQQRNNLSKEKKPYSSNQPQDKEIISMAGIAPVVRYNLTEDIEKTMRTIDEKQSQRINAIKGLLQANRDANVNFTNQLKSIKEAIVSRSISNETLNSQGGRQTSSIGFRRSIPYDSQNNKETSNRQGRTSLVFSAPNNVSVTNNNKYIENAMIAEGRGEEGARNGQLNDVLIRQILEASEKSNWISGIETHFEGRKVLDYNEDLVNGYYFKIQKNRGSLKYEFYIYSIDNLNEIEYNPIVISNKVLNYSDGEILSQQQNFFCDILSFSTDQIQGFFTSFFQFVAADQ